MWGTSDKSVPHYIENTGDTDLVLEVFPTPHYEGHLAGGVAGAYACAAEVDQHLGTGEEFLRKINKKETVVVPE